VSGEAPYEGTHYRLGRTLNSPQPLTRPHPPILVGGGGEKKTPRLVAQYADSCNIFSFPPFADPAEAARKLDVLRQHCQDVGRDYDEIEKTAQDSYDLGPKGENVQQLIEHLHAVAESGFSVAYGTLHRLSEPGVLDRFVEEIVPAVAKF